MTQRLDQIAQRKRRMNDEDRKLLRKCFRLNGPLWTYRVLAAWYGAVEFDAEAIGKIKRWNNQRLAALRFLRDLTRDYTFNAVYAVAEEVDGGWAHRLKSSPSASDFVKRHSA